MKTLSTTLVALSLSAGILAQDGTDTPPRPKPDRITRLKAACETMTRLVSLGFTTTHQTVHRVSTIRGLRAKPRFRKPPKTESLGVWHGGFLTFTVEDGDRFVFCNRQMVAADDDRDWTLRRGKTASGGEMPFVLDPQALFATLEHLDFELIHHEVGDIDGRPCETHTLRITDDAAHTLLWNGVIPTDDGKTAGGGNNFAMVQMIGNAGRIIPKPSLSVDLAISFDPATRMVYRVRGRSFTKGGNGMFRGNIMVNVRQVQQAAGEPEEAQQQPKRAQKGGYQDGLPVPEKDKLKENTVVEFSFHFKDHNRAKMPKLDNTARKLLGLSSR